MEIIKKFEPLFGEWYAESFIGAGSFGRVYKIYREEFGERFYSALKYISIPAESGEVMQLRMDGMDDQSISTYYTELTKGISAETRLMNKLRGNTNIVSFEDSKVIPKPNGMGYDIFIRMELLTGLPSRMVSSPLSTDEVVKLGTDICNALIICKQHGIIHRDIKPDNIFISDTGDFKLGDFGIARQLEKTATFMSKKGTYNYMAPEVYKGEKYGATCDLYSLGIVMYRLLNKGRLPFMPPAPQVITPGDRENAIVRRMKGETIPAPCDADAKLSTIVLKACVYDPKDRYASAEEMKAALQRYAAGEHSAPAGAIIAAEPTDGTEDGPTESAFGSDPRAYSGPTESVFTSGSGTDLDTTRSAFSGDPSVDPGEESKTSGVLTGGPLAAGIAPVDQPNHSSAAVSAQQPPKQLTAAPVPAAPKTADIAHAVQQPKEEKKKKKSGWIVAVAVVLVLAFVLCAVLGVFGNKNNNTIVDASTNTSSPTAVSITSLPTGTPKPAATPTPKPTNTPTPTLTPSPAPIPVNIGDTFSFGRYEQDNNTANGKEPINWIVLAVDGNKALVISELVLDSQPYNTEQTSITWEDCTLRAWLNSFFLNNAFNSSEIEQICLVNIENNNLELEHPDLYAPAGNDTCDKVFLLSKAEAIRLFSTDSERLCDSTAYAKAQGLMCDNNNYCSWWLRSPGNYPDFASHVTEQGGSVDVQGSVSCDWVGVRPALWIIFR